MSNEQNTSPAAPDCAFNATAPIWVLVLANETASFKAAHESNAAFTGWLLARLS